ncbi:DUF202 domain-containing protein [Streptomyces sp. NBC_01429]|uniref:DUF202 domain-containing protein n=1 Tax=Streptomyces sp. NBC_01429 TaxID=2903862 RepID=UPI002E2B0D1A|nr:DUF202 domain-containing protein [Streptomyces sp. NBC_01429]
MAAGAAGAAGAVQDRDPGLQPERTRLAWRRTTLSCTVVAVLAARQAIHGGATPAGLTAAALSALLWLGFLGVAHRRVVALTAARPRVLPAGGAVTVVVCTVLLAVCAVSIML